jgi:hypothetical protein
MVKVLTKSHVAELRMRAEPLITSEFDEQEKVEIAPGLLLRNRVRAGASCCRWPSSL